MVCRWCGRGSVSESNHVFNIITQVGSRMPLLKSSNRALHACYQSEHIIKPLLEKEWESNAKRRAVSCKLGRFFRAESENPKSRLCLSHRRYDGWDQCD